MPMVHFCLILVALPLVVRGQESATPTAAFECPCISELSPAARSALSALGYPSGYGETECKNYDETLAVSGCDSSVAKLPDYCTRPWCYVDAETCAVNKHKCEEAGGNVGSLVSPYCRSRDMQNSIVFGGLLNSTQSVFYSYATCGATNSYAHSGGELVRSIKGNNIIIALSESKPWAFRGQVLSQPQLSSNSNQHMNTI
jgi:hypothetical protein